MNGYTGERILTVSQFNAVSKMVLENEPLLKGMTLTGELSGVKRYPSGHIYFTLKDESASLSCVMFSSSAATLRFAPADGMQVKLKGGATVYERDGRYQFIARSMESDGAGGLFAAYEKLKNKLEKQGLFDERRKKAIPSFPRRIGVITSPSGAAFHDILNVTARRFPIADILLYPASVQGGEAPGELRAGVRYFHMMRNVDVIIIGRGGGSMEDLWAFNDEALARDLFLCPIPIISAVGHETDFTICDFVADKRAPTPSAAAELAVPDIEALKGGLFDLGRRMDGGLLAELSKKEEALARLGGSRALTDRNTAIDAKGRALFELSRRFDRGAEGLLSKKSHLLEKTAGSMVALNPMAILARGYSAVFDEHSRVVRSAGQLASGQSVSLRFFDGNAEAKITHITRNEEEQ